MEDILVQYHSTAWELIVSQRTYSRIGVYGWVTWAVDDRNIATLKFTQF